MPWEYLAYLTTGVPLALHGVLVVRYLPLPIAVPALEAQLPLRVLLIAAQTAPIADV